jgi:hypothetical protein
VIVEEPDQKDGLEPEPDTDAPPAPFMPAKVTMLHPNGISAEKFSDGSAQIELLISPFEVIGFGMAPETVQALLTKLSGGIEIARSIPQMDVPRGRG